MTALSVVLGLAASLALGAAAGVPLGRALVRRRCSRPPRGWFPGATYEDVHRAAMRRLLVAFVLLWVLPLLAAAVAALATVL